MHGREETDADVCTLNALTAQFRAAGGDTRVFLLGLTQSPSFVRGSARQ
jgi:hypothetical protein